MEDTAIDTLLGFSEIALALAGFAAIALVLGRREGVLPAGSAYVVQYMVVNTLGPAILALLGVVLLELDVAEPGVWRLCSGVYVAGAAVAFVTALQGQRDVVRSGDFVVPKWFTGLGWGLSAIAHSIQIVNLIGVPFGPSAGVFLLGLWVLVSLGAMQFVALLFSSLR